MSSLKRKRGRGGKPRPQHGDRPAAESSVFGPVPQEIASLSPVPVRPVVTAEMLREVLAPEDEGNQRLLAALEGTAGGPAPRPGRVVDRAPQPARHEGLAPAAAPRIPGLPGPVPVPSNPFLNAHPPRHGRPGPVRVGAALPAGLTAWERELLGRTPNPAPGALVMQVAVVDPWQQRLDHLAAFWVHCEEQFAEIDTFIRDKSQFDCEEMGRWSEHVRGQMVRRDLAEAPGRIARLVADDRTEELDGLVAELAQRIAANAKAQVA